MSYTYLILFDFKSQMKFNSFLIPNHEITYENRIALQQMQENGNMDVDEEQAKLLSTEERMEQNIIVLYLFRKSKKYREDDKEFVKLRSETYKKTHDKKFPYLSKWLKYQRMSNWTVDHSVTHIYELTNNTYE